MPEIKATSIVAAIPDPVSTAHTLSRNGLMSTNARSSSSREPARFRRLGPTLRLIVLGSVVVSSPMSAQADLSARRQHRHRNAGRPEHTRRLAIRRHVERQAAAGPRLWVHRLGWGRARGCDQRLPDYVRQQAIHGGDGGAAGTRGAHQARRPDRTNTSDLPSWRDSVTIRQLLTHTGGVVSIDDLPGWHRWKDSVRTAAASVARIANLPLAFRPGSRYAYSNSGYVVLGALIERVEGRPYADVLRTGVLTPLGLRETTPCHVAAAAGRLGAGHPVLGESVMVKPLNAAMRTGAVPGPSGLCDRGRRGPLHGCADAWSGDRCGGLPPDVSGAGGRGRRRRRIGVVPRSGGRATDLAPQRRQHDRGCVLRSSRVPGGFTGGRSPTQRG